MNEEIRDLTKGSVSRQLIRYTIPMVVLSVLQSLYHIVDLIIVGRFIGSAGIVAVTNAGQIMGFLTQIAISITVGGNVLVGQYFGSREEEKRKCAGGTLCVMSLVFGIVFMGGLYILAPQSLTLLNAPVHETAVSYIRISALGFIPVFGYNALSAIIRGVGNSKAPLYCICISTVVNVVLDIWFVRDLKLGVAGAAGATLLAQCLSFGIIFFHYTLKKRNYYGLTKAYLKIDKAMCLRILHVGFPVAMQQTIIAISWLYVLYLMNGYGLIIAAGYGVSAKIRDLCQLLTTAMMMGTSTMIAQCLGAGEIKRTREVVYTAMKLTFGMTTVLILLVEVFTYPLVGIFTTEPDIINAAVINLRIEVMGQWFFAIFYMYHALAIGAGHTLFVTVSSFVNCIIVRITLTTLVGPIFGVLGIYWVLMIATSSSIPIGIWYERSNIWQQSAELKV